MTAFVAIVCFLVGMGWGAGLLVFLQARSLEREVEREDDAEDAEPDRRRA